MDATAPTKPAKINRWLPYWAVFQADLRQTLTSWVYRVWVLVSVFALWRMGFLQRDLDYHTDQSRTAYVAKNLVEGAGYASNDLVKLSGATRPSRANEAVFERAVDDVTAAARQLLSEINTAAPRRNRDVESHKARERSRARYGQVSSLK